MAKAASSASGSKSKKSATGGGGKKVTAYQRYMKRELARLKEEKPDTPHKERFKEVAQSWASHPDNPKNKPE